MLRLFVLLTAVVCCNACRLEMFPTQDSTSSPQGCADSDGNLHDFFSEWESGPETCVCVDFGTICCKRFGNWGPTDHDYGIMDGEGFGIWGLTDHDYITIDDEGYVHDAQTPGDYQVAEDTESEK